MKCNTTMKTRCLRSRPQPGQHGTSLIEVLVALVVLSIGLLGIAGLQLSALRNNQGAYERSAAVMLVNSIGDRMLSNRGAVAGGGYNFAGKVGACTGPGSGGLTGKDLDAWVSEIHEMLGDGGCGSVQCNARLCVVEVSWDGSRGSGAAADQRDEITVEIQL